jgi:hypothetical protein
VTRREDHQKRQIKSFWKKTTLVVHYAEASINPHLNLQNENINGMNECDLNLTGTDKHRQQKKKKEKKECELRKQPVKAAVTKVRRHDPHDTEPISFMNLPGEKTWRERRRAELSCELEANCDNVRVGKT